MKDTLHILQHAVQLLAGHCDGAMLRDGQGFNKYDAHFGRIMANLPLEAWTPGKAYAIWKIIHRYKRQLAEYGIEYDQIPPPSVPDRKEKARELFLQSDNTIGVQFEYAPELLPELKQIPGRKWDPARKLWTVPLQLETIELLLIFAAKNEFIVDDTILQMLEVLSEKNQKSIEASKAHTADIEIKGLGGKLRPFQKAGVAYALEKRRTFIADQMGLGKTVEALATIHAANAFPAIVICPATLKINWQIEAKKWLPKRKIAVVNGQPIRYADFDILIINYDILGKHLVTYETTVGRRKALAVAPDKGLLSGNPQSIIFDESQYCKNHKAKRTQLVSAMSRNIPMRLALTGTPAMNRPAELLSQLTILDRLNDFGGFWNFAKRYCQAWDSAWGLDLSGAANLEELNNKLRATCFIRRMKKDVIKELPPKTRGILTVELSNRKEYERASAELIEWIGDRATRNEEFLNIIADLSKEEQQERIQERRKEAEMRAEAAEHLVRIEALKQVAAAGKREAVKEWVEDFLESGEKLVIFAHHRDVIDWIAKDFPGTPTITGATPLPERQAAVERFQKDDSCQLIAANIRAGGVGITLTAASNVLFVDLDWTPAAHDQAEDRCHRIGQEDRVNAWYMLGQHTIDQDIYELIEKKRKIVDAVTEGGEIALNESIMKDLVKRLRQRSAQGVLA